MNHTDIATIQFQLSCHPRCPKQMDYNLRQIATSNSFHRNPNSHALPKSAKVFQTGFTRHQHGFKEKRAEANICAQFIPEPPSTGSLSLDCTRS